MDGIGKRRCLRVRTVCILTRIESRGVGDTSISSYGIFVRDVEQALHHDFLPALFGEDKVDDAIRQLFSLPVKRAGIAIPNPMTTAESNWTSSTVICGHLVAAIWGRVAF
jgi:hypothetical protein